LQRRTGCQGTIVFVDLKPIAEALKIAFETFNMIVEIIYQITGISDIVRGRLTPNETLRLRSSLKVNLHL
jgi:hypothetical protein